MNSAVLALMASGFTLVFGVSRVANFAHGAMYVLCGFIVWIFINKLGLPYWLSIIISLSIVSAFGIVIYRFFFARLRGMPISEILVSLALGLLILEGLRLQGIGGFKGFIGPGYIIPVFIDRIVTFAGVMIDAHRLIIFAIGVALIISMWLFTRYTKTGLALRAIAQNERAALMLGIDSDWAGALSLVIGLALAGLAAVALLPLAQVTAEAGYDVLIIAVSVCVIGGLGSWAGTILAAIALGFTTTLVDAFGGIQYQKVVLFGAIILILIVKPSGLLGKQKELEERV